MAVAVVPPALGCARTWKNPAQGAGFLGLDTGSVKAKGETGTGTGTLLFVVLLLPSWPLPL